MVWLTNRPSRGADFATGPVTSRKTVRFSAFTVVRDMSRIVGPSCRKVMSRKGLGASRIRREAESGLAFKRTQRQTDTCHDGIPRALFFLRIGEIKAVDGAS